MLRRWGTLVAFAGALLMHLVPAAAQEADKAAAPPQPPSASAQRLYESARGKLMQVRTLLQGQDSQASVGSGFIVSNDGHVITNYHVVSQTALQPQRFRLVYSTADGEQGPLQLLAFDAIHDLALVRMVPPKAAAGAAPAKEGSSARGLLSFRPRTLPVSKGERIFSLGNPLDVGFAVLEGNYNGLVERGFYPSIFFGGALNPGMSGGPALDEQGRVMGVNVATRRDGQQVSFLVPSEFAEDLLQRSRQAKPITESVYPELTRQLLAHQALLTERFAAQAWRGSGHARYKIPVPQEEFMRCWGRSTPPESKGLDFERSDCEMDTQVFVSDSLATGNLSVRHEAYDGKKLGVLRFSKQYSDSFRNESFPRGGRQGTPAQCHERNVDRDGLPLRVVLCMSAYRKLKGLYDVSVLVATLDQSTAGVQGRFDAHGVSFDNGLRLADHYLQGFAWTSSR